MFTRLIYPSILIFLTLINLGMGIKSTNAAGFGPLPTSLKGVPIPPVPGLLDGNDPIINDQASAIALGKALFWDTAVGSDGQACASCHFNAGVDARTKNQLAPGGKLSTLPTAGTFEPTASGNSGGANYTISSADFPFFQLADPLDPGSAVIFQSDDIFGSAGTFAGRFSTALRFGSGNDACARSADPVFHVGALGTRKVQVRNAPTVINAIFNYRSFLDGRANNVFNGSNNWGDRDQNAGVWVKTGNAVTKQRLELINSSIASQATAPPINDTEMSCTSRSWPDIGRKLLFRQPLQYQQVHNQDSVLGPYSRSTAGNLIPGLNTTYRNLVTKAFNAKYWAYSGLGPFGAPSIGGANFNQMEANFSMFFGLSIQMYISTLVSDESPFDKSARDANGLPIELSASALNGLDQFRNSNCAICHIGPTFTAASVATNAHLVQTHPEAFGSPDLVIKTSGNVVNRLESVAGSTLIDTGFSSTGVSPDGADLGLGGVDDYGNPLAFSLQYLQYLAGNNAGVFDTPVKTVSPCNFQLGFALNIPVASRGVFTQVDGIIPQTQSTASCITPAYAYQPTPAAVKTELSKTGSPKTLAVVNGVYKIPGLRNIELTGPYMHNGSMASLDQVLEFYSRGGNFNPPGKNFAFVFENSDLAGNAQNRADIITFLQTLTDDRVRYEQAPFDHPAISINHGHVGNNVSISKNNPLSPNLAADEVLQIQAVGANGRATPLLPFDQTLAQ